MEMNKDIELRSYQREAIESIVHGLGSSARLCVDMAAGTGKARVVMGVIEASVRNYRILILVEKKYKGQCLYRNLQEYLKTIPAVFFNENIKSDLNEYRVVISTVQQASKLQAVASGFDLIIAHDVATNENVSKLYYSRQVVESQTNIVLITSMPSTVDVSFFGKSVYQYTYQDAISAGTLSPIEYVSGPTANPPANPRYFYQADYITKLTERFVEKFSRDDGKKAVIICRNINDAECVFDTYKKLTSFIHPVLIHSKVDQIQQSIHEFINE